MKNSIAKNTIVLSGAGILIKFMGVMYKLPIIKLLGQKGLGMYSAIYPVFAIFLVISTSALPLGISRYISKNNSDDGMSNAFMTSIIIGLIASIIIFSFSKIIANVQGNSDYKIIYFLISPTVFVTFIMGALRGYFQGKQDMKTVAISQIIEQFFKILFGLIIAYMLLGYGTIYGVTGLFSGIALSECITTFYLVKNYKKHQKINIKFNNINVIKILKIVLPISIVATLLPLSETITSIIIFPLIKYFSLDLKVKMFGMTSGIVQSIINVPLIISSSLATVLLPAVSSAKKDYDYKKDINSCLKVIFTVSVFFSVMFFIFSDEMSYFLTDNLHMDIKKEVLSNLFKFGGITIFYSSMLQILNSVMQGIGLGYKSAICMLSGIIFKIICLIILSQQKNVNLYSIFIAQSMGSGISVLCELLFLKKHISLNNNGIVFLSQLVFTETLFILSAVLLKKTFDITLVTTIIKFVFATFVYIATLLLINYSYIIAILKRFTLRKKIPQITM